MLSRQLREEEPQSGSGAPLMSRGRKNALSLIFLSTVSKCSTLQVTDQAILERGCLVSEYVHQIFPQQMAEQEQKYISRSLD